MQDQLSYGKEQRLCARDSNIGLQDGGRSRIHWAMAFPRRHDLNVEHKSVLLHRGLLRIYSYGQILTVNLLITSKIP